MNILKQLKSIHTNLMNRKGLMRKTVRLVLPLALLLAAAVFSAYFLSIPRYPATIPAPMASSYEGHETIAGFDAGAADGSFTVTTRGGAAWRSNVGSEAAQQDSIAKGINRITMLSQLKIRYVDNDNRIYTATSYANALDNGEKSLPIEKTGAKYKAVYDFVTGKEAEGLMITIPVEYEVSSGCLAVSIPTAAIRENDEFHLLDISLLPYMGAVPEGEDGYLFIPDGSGALIAFGKASKGAVEWDKEVYGRDPALKTKVVGEVSEPVRLPVFGIKRDNAAMLAIVDSGEALCSVTAMNSGMSSQWSTAYFTYRYREFDTITLNEMGWNERNIPFVSKTPNSAVPFTVRYYFLEGDDADYAGMAQVHRQYLLQKEDIRIPEARTDVPLVIDVNMSVRKVRPVLGLPVETVEALTTYRQLETMLEDFLSAGVESIVVKMDGWMDGGIYYKTPGKVTFDPGLGGKSGFMHLLSWLDDHPQVRLFPSAEFVNGYRNGNGFIGMLQGNRDITGALSLQYDFLASTGTKNLRKAPWDLITPSFSHGMLLRYLGSYRGLAAQGLGGIALDGYGGSVYSDRYESILNPIASRTPVDRETAARLWTAGMDAARETAGELMVTGGNAYAIGHADYITEIPTTSSEYDIETMTVPYYQILTTGMAGTASAPVNFSRDPDLFCLQCLEYGIYPMYSLFYAESSAVKNTALDGLYNGQYTLWLDKAVQQYEKYRDAYRRISGAFITDHEILADGRRRTVYGNGAEITVDYGAGTFEVSQAEGGNP